MLCTSLASNCLSRLGGLRYNARRMVKAASVLRRSSTAEQLICLPGERMMTETALKGCESPLSAAGRWPRR